MADDDMTHKRRKYIGDDETIRRVTKSVEALFQSKLQSLKEQLPPRAPDTLAHEDDVYGAHDDGFNECLDQVTALIDKETMK